VTWEVVLTPQARLMLETVQDRRVRESIRDRIDGLAQEPEKQGRPLMGDLLGFRSLRAVGQRYRVIYRVEKGKVLVLVVALGVRKEGSKRDVYELARKLLRLRLLS